MQQQNPTNRWKEYHHSLDIDDAKSYRQQIERLLGISPSAFCRKINNPLRLSYAEKQLIGRVYRVRKEYLFPELAESNVLIHAFGGTSNANMLIP